jgi:hypothetical protein
MRQGRRGTAWLAVAVILAGAPASAQWPNHPTANVPKLADGKPNLDAPSPRTADGKPDLSGLWRGVGSVGTAAAGATPAPNAPPQATFRDVGQNIKDGLPLTPEGREILKVRMAGNSKDNPEAHCLPMGIVQLHTQGAPRKFFQMPGELVILYEASMERREIFTDGRGLPNNDPQPWYYGYSAGRWEGDTLVVETAGFRDDGWLDIIGSPLSDAGKVTERFRRPTFGRMEIDVTVEDKKMYTRPFTVRVNQQLMLNEELLEFVCLENQRFGKPQP